MPLDPQIWLDKVRSTPLVGLRLNPVFVSASTLLEQLQPVLLKWSKGEGKPTVSIPTAFNLKIERTDGFEVTANHENLVCKFYYLSTMEEKGTRLPSISYHTEARPIRELTDEAIRILEDVAQVLWKDGHRTVERIGVVVVGNVDAEGMPPGFAMFLNHLSSPWSTKLAEINGRFATWLRQEDSVSERCHHHIEWQDGNETLEYVLDWQRLFADGRPTPYAKLKAELDASADAAFEYFGRFGLGELEYVSR